MPQNLSPQWQGFMRLDQGGGTYKLVQANFASAGLDVWTQPPGQNPDKFTNLLNIMPVSQGVLNRRAGYKLFNTGALTHQFQRMSIYQSNVVGVIEKYILGMNPTNVTALTEAGATFNASVVSPSNGQTPYALNSRNYQFFIDGKAGDLLKWNGAASGGTSQWGIASPASAPSINELAPQSATVGTIAAYNAGTPGVVCTGITNSGNGLVGVFQITTTAANGAIVGQPITITGCSSPWVNGTFPVQLVSGNTFTISAPLDVYPLNELSRVTNITYVTTLGNVQPGLMVGDTVVISGATNVSFDGTQTVTTISSGGSYEFTYNNTGSNISESPTNAIYTITALANQGGGTTTGPQPGVVVNIGRTYLYTYYNSANGHNSDLSPASASTGPLGGDDVTVGVTASTDPQVTGINLLATADGGDQTTLYLVSLLANTTGTYVDSTTEVILLANNIYQDTDDQGNLHGVALNTPPPTNSGIPLEHRGRFYILDGPSLYFSKNLDDVTTATGLITGRWEEAWPGTYQMSISSGADFGRALYSDGQVLYIGTERNIRRLTGTGPTDFQEPETIFSETGVNSQDTWDAVFQGGQLLGTMWLTADNRVILSNFSQYQNVGWPIQPLLSSLTPSQMMTARSSYVSLPPYDMWVLAIPTGGSTVNNTILVYDLNGQGWYQWVPSDTIGAWQFNVTLAGVPQLLFGSTTSNNIYNFQSSLTQDRVGNGPITYPYRITTSWFTLGDPQLRGALNELEIETQDPGMLVGVNSASTASGFLSPKVVQSGAPLQTSPWGTYKSYLAGKSTRDRYYQVDLSNTGGTTQQLLSFLSMEVVPFNRF